MTVIADADSQTQEDLRRAAVALLIEGGFQRATIPQICRTAGVDEAEFSRYYASLEAVFRAIAESLITDHSRNIEATMLRRRSLTESMRLALLAFWELVEERADDHRAAKYLRLGSPAASTSNERAIYDAFIASTEFRLTEMERVHSITWELPVRKLARLMLATLDGIVQDFLVTGDSEGAREILEVFAYHMAQHGRRVAKNYPM